MTETINAFNKFVLDSAEQYLHTVVVIDDRIYESKSGNVAAPLMTPQTRSRKASLKSVIPEPKKSAEPIRDSMDSEKLDEVSFHDVQNSFAKKRIICSLYQPKKEAAFSTRSEVYSLCSSADVVIIDWDLHGNQGSKATELVVNLIDQSMQEIPHQLRLILIYTMEANLGAVANTIYEGLTSKLGERSIELDENAELILKTHNSRVVILGKRPNTALSQYSGFIVPERELAQRTIIEFSHLASGLLQAIVLRGVANLRENNRRILMRFNSSLDAAFLAHRALLLPNDALGQIIPLLTDELRAVLEDSFAEYPLGISSEVERIIFDWCEKHWKAGSNSQLNIGVGANALDFAKDVFCNGPSIKKDYSRVQKSEIPGLIDRKAPENPKWVEKKCIKLAEYLSSDAIGDFSHEKLSSLMSQRVAYENARKTLHLGVILRTSEANQRYMICLQPVCDSVRINGKVRTFIFCYLDLPETGKPFTHAIMDFSSTPIHLNYKPTVSKCFVANFKTGADAICAAKDDKCRFFFEDEDKNRYEWIAELKTEHAQRAAEEFGRTLSRVGLNESEWIRLKSR